ncbi:hypothetical protein SAMN05216276_11522 [Streptosporangium subroseum]|uniref:Uncharacterized protein n=1 Tax=Streptosporangium subroseum TaxID=106412 RepID=A0A239PDG1_9ACTN|nr:hypothetical protein [Streptosporangium subroseum]SNT65003.1 hypothetical protein SAMN05216276_11522 [Streptosporangium subroseum]
MNRIVRFLGLSATAGALSLGLFAPAAEASALVDRTATVNITFDMMDHENFGKNERCRYNLPLRKTGRIGGPARNFKASAKCGGEIRTEIYYRLQWAASSGMLTVDNIVIWFFEGDSADTPWLKGQGSIGKFLLWPGRTATRQIRVQNDWDGQRDDRTILTFTVGN